MGAKRKIKSVKSSEDFDRICKDNYNESETNLAFINALKGIKRLNESTLDARDKFEKMFLPNKFEKKSFFAIYVRRAVRTSVLGYQTSIDNYDSDFKSVSSVKDNMPCTKEAKYSKDILMGGFNTFYFVGYIMEKEVKALAVINEEVEKSKELLQNLHNQISISYDLLQPKLISVVKDIRQNRMTVTTELGKSLKILKDVREFFMDSDYKHEIERLKEFTALALELKKLIDNGTMDVISDVMLKLAIKEV